MAEFKPMNEVLAEMLKQTAEIAEIDKLTDYPRTHPALEKKRVTFADLCKVEPELSQVVSDARKASRELDPDNEFALNNAWYGRRDWQGRGFKARVENLVGWDARVPALRSHKFYDIAYQHVYRVLGGEA